MKLGEAYVLITGDSTQLTKTLDNSKRDVTSWTSSVGGFAKNAFSFATGGAILSGIESLAGGLKDIAVGAIQGNAEFERYNTQFGVLLGGATAAKERLAELVEFAKVTPFELPEVVQADKVMQSFGLHAEDAALKWGISGKEIRTIAGDVAAGAGVDYAAMAGYIGKFSTGATGEAIQRFQELGVVTRDQLRLAGIEFDKGGAMVVKSQADVDKATGILLKLMKEKYGGMMDAQSKTFEGMTSNLNDWWGQTTRKVAEPIFDAIKENLKKVMEYLDSPEVKAAIKVITDWLTTTLPEAIKTVQGILTEFGKSGFPGLLSGIKGWATSDEVKAKLGDIGKSIGTTIGDAIKSAAEDPEAAKATIWAFIKALAKGVLDSFVAIRSIGYSVWVGIMDGLIESILGGKSTEDTKVALGILMGKVEDLPKMAGIGYRLGTAIGEGLRNGIIGMVNSISESVIAAARAAVEAAKRALGIHSPSTVFAGIGQQAMAGLSQGIMQGIPQAAQSGRVAAQAVAGNSYQFNITSAYGNPQNRSPRDEMAMWNMLFGGATT